VPCSASHELTDSLDKLSRDCTATLLQHSQQLDLPAGKTLFHDEDGGNDCYWVIRGLLKSMVIADCGAPVVVGLHGAGELLGNFAQDNGESQPITVEAIADCRLTVIKARSFQAALSLHPEFAWWLTRHLVLRVRAAYDYKAGKSGGVAGRVARALLTVAKLTGETLEHGRMGLPVALSHNTLASLADVSRESATRTLSHWRKMGIIDQSVEYPLILSKVRLEREAAI